MLAAPPQTTKHAPCDTECYPNYWFAGFKFGDTVHRVEAKGAQNALSVDDRAKLSRIMRDIPLLTFNGLHYDRWMLDAAVAGYTCEQLKRVNDAIIKDKASPYDLGIPRHGIGDHIDVMPVIPGAGGQKYKAGIIHYQTMRDLPYTPDRMLTPAMARNVAEYNANDLGQLEALATHPSIVEALDLRCTLSGEYTIDVRSMSDAQVAEAILVSQCEKVLGHKIARGTPDPFGISFNFDAPDILQFRSPQFQEVARIASRVKFGLTEAGALAMPPALRNCVGLGRSRYKFGMGGLHSQEEGQSLVCGPDELLIDIDADSYYPSLMLRAGAWPEKLGPQFLTEFAAIRERRLHAKREERPFKSDPASKEYKHWHAINLGMKIMINGTFGKTGSIYSPLFAPKMCIQTTITGQLLLLMLIDALEYAGISIVSANTDGIVAAIKLSQYATLDACVKWWENMTGFTTERTAYDKLHSHAINDYVARYATRECRARVYIEQQYSDPSERARHLKMFADEAGLKRKGEFAKTDLAMKKAPDCEVCADAVAAWIADGTQIETTIYQCGDVRKFVRIQNAGPSASKMWGEQPRKGIKVCDMLPRLAAHGWQKAGRKWQKGNELLPAKEAYEATFTDPIREEPLGKVLRWYYSTDAPGPIVISSGPRTGNTVPESWGAKPCMELPSALPIDIDYEFYIARARKMLAQTGVIL